MPQPANLRRRLFLLVVLAGGVSLWVAQTESVLCVIGGKRRRAEKLVIGCEGCSPEDAELPFDNVLDRVTGNDSAITDYIFVEVSFSVHVACYSDDEALKKSIVKKFEKIDNLHPKGMNPSGAGAIRAFGV